MKHIIFAALIFLTACGGAQPSQSQPQEPTTHRVTYELTGSRAAEVDVTAKNASGATQQQQGVHLPWTVEFEVPSGQFVYVSAQIAKNGDEIACKIMIDGQVLQEAESTGEYSIATCSGSAR